MIECPHCSKKFFPKEGQDHCPFCGESLIWVPHYTEHKTKNHRVRNLAIVATIAAVIILYVIANIGFYSIPPIGILPEGATWLVWREGGEPLYNSPDGVCLRAVGEVTLLCRAAALAAAPTGRIIARFSYDSGMYQKSLEP